MAGVLKYSDTPTAKARWVLEYNNSCIIYNIVSKKTNKSLAYR